MNLQGMSIKKAAALAGAALVVAQMAGATASAQTLASNTFTSNNQGWANGDFDTVGSTSAVIFNAGAGTISVNDAYFYNAFVAPSAYLGNQSAAFGGTISFQLSAAATDGIAFSPLALIGGGLTLYANRVAPPGTSLTDYTIGLTGAQFYVGGDPYSGIFPTATDAQLQTVLGDLQRFAIQADWRGGDDFVTLDNVTLAGAGVVSPVPEPAGWAMMFVGFGVLGGLMRRRARTTVRYA